MSQTKSADLQARAAKVLPAGGFGNFDASVIIDRGLGCRVWDVEGNEYIDYLIGSGPMLVGHCNPEVDEVVKEQMSKGATFFANSEPGIELAEVICDAVACADQLRYVSSGGEADMYAMRLARAHTSREKILKFEGGYHGMSAEALMSLAPSQLENFPTAVPDSAGIPEAVKQGMLIAPFNDIDAVKQLVAEHQGEIAAIIVEPLQRLIPPKPGFLQALRELASANGIVLIFDEVVTGFRFAYGGAQELYGVTPDLCTLGKAIGGGYPLAAIAGKAEIMAHFDKSKVGSEGFCYQVGTLSGNPIASVAGLKTLEILRRPGTYEDMRAKGNRIMDSLATELSAAGIAHRVVGDPTLFDVVFTSQDVSDYRHVFHADKDLAARFNKALRKQGILKPAGKFYTAQAHTELDIEQTEAAIRAAATEL